MTKQEPIKVIFKGEQIDKMLSCLKKELRVGSCVRVGWLKGPHKSEDSKTVTMEEVVLKNEFGTITQPARPFIRPVVKKGRRSWPQLANVLIKQNLEVKKILLTLGEQVKNDLKRKILSNIPPPNSPYTIKKKGSDQTLRDTGAMLGSIHSEIVKNK